MTHASITEAELPAPDAPWEPVVTRFAAGKQALATEAAGNTAWPWYQQQMERFARSGELPEAQSALLSMLVMEYRIWQDHRNDPAYQPPTQMVRAVLDKLNAQLGSAASQPSPP